MPLAAAAEPPPQFSLLGIALPPSRSVNNMMIFTPSLHVARFHHPQLLLMLLMLMLPMQLLLMMMLLLLPLSRVNGPLRLLLLLMLLLMIGICVVGH
jgi:hypothetical protein